MSERDVFINCPFSDDYRAQFNAITYTVIRSEFAPRCAREWPTRALRVRTRPAPLVDRLAAPASFLKRKCAGICPIADSRRNRVQTRRRRLSTGSPALTCPSDTPD